MITRSILFFLLIGLILSTTSFTGARAETRFPVVPSWLDNNPDQTRDIAAAIKKQNVRMADMDITGAREDVPSRPVITPHHTMDVLHQIDRETKQPVSALEASYSGRIVDQLEQFGYDMFGTINNLAAATDIPGGAVQDDFVLGSGDTLTVTFRGQRTDSKTYTINRQGLLIVDDLPPFSASGQTIGNIRNQLESYAAQLHNTQVYISLDAVRQIGVLVVGHVKQPGRQNLTVFHTVLDALMEAGGVEKTGSLRQIKLVRDGRSTYIDLYGLLIHGSAGMDLSLRNGDRIIVPPIGPTVGIAGNIKRPGIYEIQRRLSGMWHKPDRTSDTLNLEDMLSMAGGILSPGENRFLDMGLSTDGQESIREVTDPYAATFRDGTILMVQASDEKRRHMVELTGHTRRGGLHALNKAETLAALLSDDKVFGPDIYPLMGVIERWNGDQLAAEMIAFPPLLVLKGQFDSKLQDGDVVHLFSRAQIQDLQTNSKDIPGKEEGSAPEIDDDRITDPVLAAFLRERSAYVRGAVRQEGEWPVAEGVTLDNILAVSGGMTLDADTSNIEVTASDSKADISGNSIQRLTIDTKETNPKDITIAAGDAVRVNQKYIHHGENSVLIIGEVLHPGRYDLLPGDKMSDLMARAGGLTEQAYPAGAIFSREAERKAEEARFHMQAQDLEIKLAAALEQKEQPDTTQISAVQQLIGQLRQAQAVGRITVESDPGILSSQPELDILLETGDRIYIPKRPLTVRVNGEVLSPAALQFRKDKDPRDYITEAGGMTYHADKERAFVLYPDGSAQPLQISNWNHRAVFIPPGSTIVVPRDPKPFDFIETARDLSQIIANLAITGIWLDDLSH
ncbi:MAG: SLBB domain-containing protein [Rhodospirillales bacterium]|nr:SLBB domain-containing protein [Rhodospirillales bacterium]